MFSSKPSQATKNWSPGLIRLSELSKSFFRYIDLNLNGIPPPKSEVLIVWFKLLNSSLVIFLSGDGNDPNCPLSVIGL